MSCQCDNCVCNPPIVNVPTFPSHPIVLPPGVPPLYPTHPIVIPPGSWYPGTPSHPIALPPGVPTHPIYNPPGVNIPTFPTQPIYWPDPSPEHPIVLPPTEPDGPPPGFKQVSEDYTPPENTGENYFVAKAETVLPVGPIGYLIMPIFPEVTPHVKKQEG